VKAGLEIKRSGIEDSREEEIWFMDSERIRWLTRAEISEQPDKCLAALKRVGFNITMAQLQEALTARVR
jgi:hypothetical protein